LQVAYFQDLGLGEQQGWFLPPSHDPGFGKLKIPKTKSFVLNEETDVAAWLDWVNEQRDQNNAPPMDKKFFMECPNVFAHGKLSLCFHDFLFDEYFKEVGWYEPSEHMAEQPVLFFSLKHWTLALNAGNCNKDEGILVREGDKLIGRSSWDFDWAPWLSQDQFKKISLSVLTESYKVWEDTVALTSGRTRDRGNYAAIVPQNRATPAEKQRKKEVNWFDETNTTDWCKTYAHRLAGFKWATKELEEHHIKGIKSLIEKVDRLHEIKHLFHQDAVMNNMLKIFDSGHPLSTVVGAQELLKPKLLELKNAKAKQIAKSAKEKEKAAKKDEADRKRAQQVFLLDEGADDAEDYDDVPSNKKAKQDKTNIKDVQKMEDILKQMNALHEKMVHKNTNEEQARHISDLQHYNSVLISYATKTLKKSKDTDTTDLFLSNCKQFGVPSHMIEEGFKAGMLPEECIPMNWKSSYDAKGPSFAAFAHGGGAVSRK
jgi:hypothetical protein